jgi:5'-3' exonuclease
MKTFKQLNNGTNLLVVDSLNLAFRFAHRGATDFAEEYLDTVNSLKRSYSASHVIIAADHGSSSFRKGIYPAYKQNRKDKYANQSDDEKAKFEVFFEDYVKTLEYIKDKTDYPVLRFHGVEADDICAYICHKIKTQNIWLISSDKDYDLLVSDTVSRFSYVTRKEVTLENWYEHYDFPPEDYASIKALMGDTGDNVIGVESVGPKTAAKLVAQYGSIWDIIAELPLQGKYKYIQKLNEFGADRLTTNMMLVDLVTYCGDAIGQENIEEINKTLELMK